MASWPSWQTTGRTGLRYYSIAARHHARLPFSSALTQPLHSQPPPRRRIGPFAAATPAFSPLPLTNQFHLREPSPTTLGVSHKATLPPAQMLWGYTVSSLRRHFILFMPGG